jgi:transcriptional activator protein UGA3
MAIESKPLQISLVAWSSAHLSRLSKTHEITALENRSSALVHVASSLCAAPVTASDYDTMLASCLVLCATEIALGDTENWYWHLQGARQIIMAARGRGKGGHELRGAECYMKSADGQWLLRNFAYHDVLGSVTSTEGPLLKGAYFIDEEATETIVDAYVGIGHGVLAILSDICNLDTWSVFPMIESAVVEEEDGDDTETKVECNPGFWQTTDELESRLRHWNCPKCSDPILVDLAEAYRHSAFIALYRKQRSYLTSFPQQSPGRSLPVLISKMSESIGSTITNIQGIPVQSLPECGLLFPLFMVGGETLEAKNIELVRLRIQTLLKDRGFGNIGKAQEVLEELWRLRISGARGPEGRELDWMDILSRKKWRLMLS